MNALIVCLIAAFAVSASAFSSIGVDIQSLVSQHLKIQPEKYPPAPKPVASTVTKGKFYTSNPLGATNNQYIQWVVFRNNDCTGDVLDGGAYLLNYCWLYGYGNPATMTDPYYIHFNVASNNTLSFNVHNTSNCAGPTLYRANNVVTVGCTNSGNVGIRGVVTKTPLWPQGQNGASIKLHHNSKSCMADDGFAYNFNSEYYMKLNTCMNYTMATANAATTTFKISTCQQYGNNKPSGSFNIMTYNSNDCTGPATSNTFTADYLCNDGVTVGTLPSGEFGYASFGCFDEPKHNKCYENFGISSTPCDAKLTEHTLKFTCNDPSYTGCESMLLNDYASKSSEVFSCCV